LAVKQDADGAVVDVDVVEQPTEVEYEVPFNLQHLRRHLAEVTLHRRVLPEDNAARQKLLEESVYDVAVERWKHEADMFEQLGLGKKGLDNSDLRTWMWNWHQKLASRIAAELTSLLAAEARLSESRFLVFVFSYGLTLVQPRRSSTSGWVHSCLSSSRKSFR
jgi:DNA-directed RNA polymerase, mitochondrial